MNDDLLEILTDPTSSLCQAIVGALECKSFAPFLSDWATITVQRALLREKEVMVSLSWYSWVTRWLSSEDRSEESALKAARSIPSYTYGGSAYHASMSAAEAVKANIDVISLVAHLWCSARMHDYNAFDSGRGSESLKPELEREYQDICFIITEGYFPGVHPREVSKIVAGMKQVAQRWAEREEATKEKGFLSKLKSLFTGELSDENCYKNN